MPVTSPVASKTQWHLDDEYLSTICNLHVAVVTVCRATSVTSARVDMSKWQQCNSHCISQLPHCIHATKSNYHTHLYRPINYSMQMQCGEERWLVAVHYMPHTDSYLVDKQKSQWTTPFTSTLVHK